jgi:hypothetical protein
MKNSTEDREKNLNKPMKIKIMVQGEIVADWSERLANMQNSELSTCYRPTFHFFSTLSLLTIPPFAG